MLNKKCIMALLPVWVLAACQQKGQAGQQVNANTAKPAALQPTMPVMCGAPGPNTPKVPVAGQLNGRWSSVGQGRGKVAFIIDAKTIYYPDSHARHLYHTLADSLYIVYNEGYTVPLGYGFNGTDTLRLTGEDGPGYYVRVKK